MEQSLPLPAQPAQQPWVGAGFLPRAAGQIIDLIIHYVVWFVVGAIFVILMSFYAGFTGTPLEGLTAKLEETPVAGYLLAMLGYILYHTLAEGLHGATLGKRIFKLHVLKEDGEPASIGHAFMRSIGFYIDTFFFGLVAVFSMNKSALQQRVGDKLAKTIVVERKSLEQHEWPSGWRFFFAFLLGLAADGLMAFLSIVIRYI